MAKLKTYRLSLTPIKYEDRGAYKMESFMLYDPRAQSVVFEASSIDEVLTRVAEFAKLYRLQCAASVQCKSPPKPAGFDARTRRLRFNEGVTE